MSSASFLDSNLIYKLKRLFQIKKHAIPKNVSKRTVPFGTGDAIALLMLIKGNSNIKWTGKKDKNGKYIPSSISFSFEDDELNQSLSDYLAIEEGSDLEINIEDQKARLLFNQTELKKPGE